MIELDGIELNILINLTESKHESLKRDREAVPKSLREEDDWTPLLKIYEDLSTKLREERRAWDAKQRIAHKAGLK